jgi:hypothetical protein
MLTSLLVGALTLTLNIQQGDSSKPIEVEWARKYGGADEEVANSIVKTTDGGYALAGYAKKGFNDDFWLVKVDSLGNHQWNKTYDRAYSDIAFSVVETADGGYALAGITYASGTNDDFWLVKVDSLGNHQWNKTYGAVGNERAYSVVETSDGYALAGQTGPYENLDFMLVKVDSYGNMQWNLTYGGAKPDNAYSVVETSDGYALAGYTYSFGAGKSDFWLVKVAAHAHDLAVTNTVLSKTVVGQGFTLNVNVTVENQGYNSEIFNLTTYANATPIQTFNITNLLPGSSTTITFNWNTSGFAKGNYTISAYASPVDGETDTGNNLFTDGFVKIGIPGDINGDTVVDSTDLGILGSAWGSFRGDLNYVPEADINDDGVVDSTDLGIMGAHWGETE